MDDMDTTRAKLAQVEADLRRPQMSDGAWLLRWCAGVAAAVTVSLFVAHAYRAPWWVFLILELTILPLAIYIALNAPSRKDRTE